MPAYVRYTDDVETVQPGEAETTEKIITTMQAEERITRGHHGHSVRTSFGKSLGLLTGELRVYGNLPPELCQGLFAEPRTYPVLVRLSHAPGEYLPDTGVSSARAMSLKVFGVPGERLTGHDAPTQDFILSTGTTFPPATPSGFLRTASALQKAARAPEALKHAVSATARVTNAALNKVGLNAPNLDQFGHPPIHPLGEPYYSQAPLRFGEHVAKLAAIPAGTLRELGGQRIERGDDSDALRTSVSEHFRTGSAEFDLAVQLCTDLERMPVENTSTEWSEAESPYRPVARLILTAQDAAERIAWEKALTFNPAHSLAAHRPLGGINRARLRAYTEMGALRLRENGASVPEPHSLDDLPSL